MSKVLQLAQVIRSKNSGPFEITFDVIFDDRETYQKVKDSGVLTVNLVCSLYGVQPSDIRAFTFFNPAQAFKFTLKRGWPQGSSGERDTFGTQQHAPLLDIDIPGVEGAKQ